VERAESLLDAGVPKWIFFSTGRDKTEPVVPLWNQKKQFCWLKRATITALIPTLEFLWKSR
jgi:hypothetical protein